MLRAFRYIVIAVIGLVLLTVALANRAPVMVRLLPDDMAAFLGLPAGMEMPLFLPICTPTQLNGKANCRPRS